MIRQHTSELYLDSNATTPVIPEAMRAARLAMEDTFGNPSSSHTIGLRARSLMEQARELARSVLGAGNGQIVFTSGATEAIHTAVFSALCEVRRYRCSVGTEKPGLLLYGATEHKAVPQALAHWNEVLRLNDQLVEIPVDSSGMLDLEFLVTQVPEASMVCTMAVNNETGAIHDLRKIDSAVRSENKKVLWLADCVQAVGKMPLGLRELTVDYAVASGHKIYATKGIGLLYCRHGKPLTALLPGGSQEQGARGGTENLSGVASIAAILKKLDQSPNKTFADADQLKQFRDQLVAALQDSFPGIVFNTDFDQSVPTTINFAVDSVGSDTLLDLFDAAGLQMSSGSACGSGVARSYVLEAMGLPLWRSEGSIRLSFGPLDTQAEIDQACSRIRSTGHALTDSCMAYSQDHGRSGSSTIDGLVQLKKGSDCTWVYIHNPSKTCVVIDPFEGLADRVELLVRCQRCRVVAILDTHAHVDHESARYLLSKKLDDCLEPSAFVDDGLGWPICNEKVALGDGSLADNIRIGKDLVLARTELPGHTLESYAYLLGKADQYGKLLPSQISHAFTGDTILAGGVGRTDFESSSVQDMYHSIKRLPKYIDMNGTILCPTHDYHSDFVTTLAAEKSGNGLLQQFLTGMPPMSLKEFLALKPQIDKQISDHTGTELVCGYLPNQAEDACPRTVRISGPHELTTYLKEHPHSVVIDVREPHEFSFTRDWFGFGLNQPPRNIPLSQLANALPELLNQGSLVFLCRSGRRSLLAAKVALRLGAAQVSHLQGGLALNRVPHRHEIEFMI